MALKPIPSFEEYLATDSGDILSKKYGRPLKYGKDKDGYKRVTLYVNGTPNYRRVCRLVCETFKGSPPSPQSVVRHLDGSKTNDKQDNLEWGTPQENSNDCLLHGTRKKGEDINTAKLTEDKVRTIRKEQGTLTSIAQKYGVSFGTIGHIKQGRTWKHVGP